MNYFVYFLFLIFISFSIHARSKDFIVQLTPDMKCQYEKYHVFIYKKKDPHIYIYHIEASSRAKIQISLKKGPHYIEAVAKNGCSGKLELISLNQIQKLRINKND